MALIQTLAADGLEALRTLLGPAAFGVSIGLLGLVGWSLWGAARTSLDLAQTMHQIPCANCVFFTDDHRLKCPVHPTTAASEAAIGCVDYHPQRSL